VHVHGGSFSQVGATLATDRATSLTPHQDVVDTRRAACSG
jgi:hypothetical protein